jgi:Flp pilus assembly pilin Flp
MRHNSRAGRACGPDEKGKRMNLFVLRTWLQTKVSKDERGASMVEYILLVALIALAVIAAVVFLRTQVQSKFSDAGSQLSNSGT